jgi:hypothetical protein
MPVCCISPLKFLNQVSKRKKVFDDFLLPGRRFLAEGLVSDGIYFAWEAT